MKDNKIEFGTFLQDPHSKESQKKLKKHIKERFSHHRSGSQGRDPLLGVDDEPISSYVPQTMTFQHRSDKSMKNPQFYAPMQYQNRSAEGEKLDFTAKKDPDNKAHSAREDKNISQNLGPYTMMKEDYKITTKLGVPHKKLETVETNEHEESEKEKETEDQKYTELDINEGSEDEQNDSEEYPSYYKNRPRHSHAHSLIDPNLKHSHISNLGSGLRINKNHTSQYANLEIPQNASASTKWKKKFQKLKKQYKLKCMEFEESLAYLDIEGEQNKILENKTVELQQRVENEIRMIKEECEDIIMEREGLHKEEIELVQMEVAEKDVEIERLQGAYENLEEEMQQFIKNFNRDLSNKEEEFESYTKDIARKSDIVLQNKLDKIVELERKINKMRLEHQDEISMLKEQVEKTQSKYRDMLKEKERELNKTGASVEGFKHKKDLEMRVSLLEKEVDKKTRECSRLKEEIEGFNEIIRGKEYYFKCAKDNQEYITNKTKDEVQSLRKLLIEEQSKNKDYKATLQQKEFFEEQYELLKNELMKEKSNDSELRLGSKVRELQRQVTDMQLLLDSKDSNISQLESRLKKYDTEFASGTLISKDPRYRGSVQDSMVASTTFDRQASRCTSKAELDWLKKDREVYEIKVKLKDQEMHIQRLEGQLAKHLEIMKKSNMRYVYS
ncbi:unnamed protein product [Moneuplotes crassus]|uniref:Uncharacterized protein n=2 Tax=Euplotes crassus TaxID=5936 RepID=A0AAD1U352_EUPCR|nr:unnamed protein product [Moneuplotes crassus]